MAKYLRLFNTHENYKTELQSGKLELSNVSLISREKSIQYERNSPNILKCTYEISQQDFDDNTELVSSFGGIPLMVNADSYLHGYKINGEEVIIDPLTKLDLGGGIIEYEYLDNKYIPKSNYRIKFSEKITEFLILLDDNSDIDNIINNYYISVGILDGNDNILEDEWMCQTLTEAVYQNQLLILDDVNKILQLSSAFLSALEYMEETAPGGSMFISLVDQPYVDGGGQIIPSINTKIQKYFTSGGIGNITVTDPGKYTLEYDFNYSGIQDIVFNFYGIAHEAFSHLITRFDSSKLLPISELNYIIPTNLFEYNSNLNKLILENITKINPHAIYSCNNLTKLTIPNSVVEIGEDNFKECNNLKEIIIDCEIIKSSWFQDNTTIESIILGPNVKIIESNAFAGCTSLHYVHISQSLKFIGENAFGGCENLKNIDVFDINSWCNIDFENINSNPLSINNGVLSINGEEANNIKISGKTKAIKKNAFYGCSNIIMVTLYNGVESIEENAFYGCSNLLSVTIPSSMKNIKNGAFGECDSLGFISFPNKEDNIITLDLNCAINTTPWYQSWIRKNHHDGLLYLESWLVKHVGLIPEKSSIEVREGTNIIMEGAFLYEDGKDFTGQPNLININLPTSLEYIKSYAFYNCTGLKSLIITENIVEIMQGAFMECINLKVLINKSRLDLQLGSEEHGYVAYYANKFIDNIINGYVFEKINSINYLSDYIGNEVNLILPSEYLGGNYQIKENAFKNREDIVSINSLENSKLTKINDNAFYGSSKLISVSIPQNVTSIGKDVFYGCNSLERVTINCATVGDWFNGLSSIKEVVLGDGVTSIGTYSFSNCNNLTSITIPEDSQLTSIGHEAFSYCSGLKSITIPASVTWIGRLAFCDCHSLTTITISENSKLTSIEGGTFDGCSGLTAINVPESVTWIGDYSFRNCSNLTSITIPESMTRIGRSAFYNCSSLTTINIPESVISIGNSSFDGCSNLVGVYINSIEDWCNITFGTEYANPLSYSHKLFLNGELIEDLNIPVGVTTLKDHVFAGNTFKSITLPKTLTSLGVNSFGWSVMESEYESTTCYAVNPPQSTENSFYVTHVNKPLYVPYQSVEAYKTAEYWSRFTNIQPLPEIIDSGNCGNNLTWEFNTSNELIIKGTGVMIDYTGMAPWAKYQDKITKAELPKGLTHLGYRAFYGCSKLTSIIIPESVTSIGDYAFECCYNLISINITENSQLKSIGNRAFRDCNKLASITIPAGVTDIGSNAYLENSAFFNCGVIKVINYSNLSIEGIKRSTRADIVYQGSELTTVGDYQFYTSDGIHSLVNYIGDDTEIVLPDSYNGENYNIGDYAFYNCSNLTAINIPEGVTGLGNYAFYNCSSLTVITIPASVTTIWTSTFNKCSGLTSIVVAEGNTKYDSRNGCNAIINTSSNKLLVGCSTSVIPESVTIIGDRAFRECESLTAITIPEGVISIGKYAFYRCYNLTDITISASVTGIGDNAFQYCHNLISINITENSQLTGIGKDAFSFCSKLTSITIPEGVTSIGSVAFYDCSWLNKVINYSNLSLSKGSTGYGYVAYYADIVYQGSELTTVGDYQFYTSDGIHSLVNYVGNDTKIVLPDSYNGENYNIGDWAFGGCSSLTSITIPESMTGIGSYAFYGCKSLKEITVNCLVAPSLGSYVFGDSSSNYTGRNTYNQGINKLYIPENVTDYNTGQWLDPLQSSEKCGFSIEYIVIDPLNGYEYVDLGLPSGTLWAKCNIGAENETDYGLYFAWGEVVGYNSSQVGYGDNQRPFEGTDYKWNEGEFSCDGSSITKYKPGLDNLTTLLPGDDAASVNMGGSWHMPSKEQLEELINSSYTTTTWTTRGGINGRLITSKTNGNTLFLPASGYCGWGYSIVGSYSSYWSSSLFEDNYKSAKILTFDSDFVGVDGRDRCVGLSVRGVIG